MLSIILVHLLLLSSLYQARILCPPGLDYYGTPVLLRVLATVTVLLVQYNFNQNSMVTSKTIKMVHRSEDPYNSKFT